MNARRKVTTMVVSAGASEHERLVLDVLMSTGVDLRELDAAIALGLQYGADVEQLQGDRAQLLDDLAAGRIRVARYIGRQLALQLRLAAALPRAEHGGRFYGKGKAPDALGKWLDRELARDSKATTADLWERLAKAPPRGYVFEEGSFGGTLYLVDPWTEACTSAKWRDRVRRARERAIKRAAK